MSDSGEGEGFFEDEARDVEDSEEEDIVAPARRAKGKTMKGRAGGGSEDEADDNEEDASGGDNGYVDSSEEEDEGQDEYEKDDFLVDEDEVEDDEEDDVEQEKAKKKKKKKGKKKRKRLALDEDDYDLLEDNTGVRVKRPQHMRRIARKGGTVDELEEDDHRTAQQKLQEDLFGGDDDLDEDEDDLGGAGGHDDVDDEDDVDDDEDGLDDFIVEGDEDGEPGSGKRRRRRKRRGVGHISSEALEEAQEIFGDVDNFLQKYRDLKARNTGQEMAEDELNELDMSDEEEAADMRAARIERKEQRRLRMVRERIEPDLLAKYGLTDEDELIRKIDIPERFATQGDMMEAIHEGNVEEAAEWVYQNLFGTESRVNIARNLVEDGLREVDMLPLDGRKNWDRIDLEGDIMDIKGLRGVTRPRDDVDAWRSNKVAQDNLVMAITEVLRCLYIEKEEIPLIAMYRKERCGELLASRKSDLPRWTTRRDVEIQRERIGPDDTWFPEGAVQAKHRRARRWEVLWAIWESSKTYAKLLKRRQARTNTYEGALGRATTDEERSALESCVTSLSEASSFEAIDDIEAKFRLIMIDSRETPASGEARKNPKKTSLYSIARKSGIGAVMPSMGITAAQFGENLQQGYKKHEPEDPQVAPLEFVAPYAVPGSAFADPAKILAAAQHMAAVELAADPNVRQEVRRLMLTHQDAFRCTISTEPTARGEEVLDPFHVYGSVKRLRDKPLDRFQGSEQYLYIKMAEAEGLITATVGLREGDLDRLVDRLKDKYVSEGVSLICQQWNGLREKILRDAVVNHIMPAINREMRTLLESDARQQLLTNYASALWELAITPPLQIMHPEDDEYLEELRVMAVTWGPGGNRRDSGPPTVAVMLDAAGNMVDFIKLPQLSGRGPRPGTRDKRSESLGGIFHDPRKERDAHRMRDFIMQHEPHVIIVGASGLDSWQLKADMETIRDNILEHDPEFMTRMDTGTIEVRFASDVVSKLWASTAEAQEEITEQGDQVRRGVGLGRSVIEPLAVLAGLCGPAMEVLSLPLHPLQKAVANSARHHVVEQVMITAVNQIGVDLNLAVQCSWMAPMLRFVCGLGRRKAAALISAVSKRDGGFVQSRREILSELGVMDKKVFINCGPFLRIRRAGSAMVNLVVDRMDDTRIHPMHYEWAVRIAQDALMYQGQRGVDEAKAIENAMEKPDSVLQLDMWDAADKLKQNEGLLEEAVSRLIDIQYELVSPYGEVRGESLPPSDADIFHMLTSDGCDNGLKKGKMVEALVTFLNENEVECELEGRIPARIERGYLSSSRNPDDIRIRDLVARGQNLTARIVDIDYRGFAVRLTCRSADLADDVFWEETYCAYDDPYYYVLTDDERAEKLAAKKRAASRKVDRLPNRPIRHERYRNLSAVEASEFLKDADVGEFIFRPSSQGLDRLGLTLVVYGSTRTGNHMLHLPIREGPKSGSGPGAKMALGKWLCVDSIHALPKGEKYEDLDEVVVRFVEPLVANIKSIISNRKFLHGSKDELDTMLTNQKSRYPQQAVYCLGVSLERVGYFYLAHILNRTPHHEYIYPTNQGICFRARMFDDIDLVINHFKMQPIDPARRATEQDRARVPAGPSRTDNFRSGGQPSGPYADQSSARHMPPGHPRHGGGSHGARDEPRANRHASVLAKGQSSRPHSGPPHRTGAIPSPWGQRQTNTTISRR
uniref:Transcription elongation factor SPT6 n=1 Tax=Tetraselmis sp. GSL018 TaxID=582737 RepID=A0A061RB87_9CHLO|mmetsp:Transcript_12879/g.30554  ORF Transcript_12879/g.30554 Transcript_12879/m.30554 type:complete len:1694 (-) Transcript_12879:384-5465(-)